MLIRVRSGANISISHRRELLLLLLLLLLHGMCRRSPVATMRISGARWTTNGILDAT